MQHKLATSSLLAFLLGCGGSTPSVDVVAEAAAVDDHSSVVENPHWDYAAAGPNLWASLSSEFSLCAEGSEQSPIDLPASLDVDSEEGIDQESMPFTLEATSTATPLGVVDNGHTIQASLDEGNSLGFGGTEYELKQYHFHAPSEHTIEGRHAPLEVHFVHQSLDGGLAVVGVLMEEGTSNSALQPLWQSLPEAEGSAHRLEDYDLDLDALVPEGGDFYHYRGSLTTPPCSEGVLWLVRQEALELSGEQIGTFTALIQNNNRPVQPLNERVVVEETPTYIE